MVVVLVGCGRLGFDPASADGDAGGSDGGSPMLAPGWSTQLAGSDDGVIHIHEVHIAPNGDFVMGAHFEPTMDAGFGSLSSDGFGGNVFVGIYAPDGTPRDYYSPTGSGDEEILGIAVDDGGNIYATGWFDGGFTPAASPLISNDHDGFLVSLSPDATVRWAVPFGGNGDDFGFAVSAAGSIVCVSTEIAAQADFGDPDSPHATGGPDVVVVAFSTDGVPLWSRAAGGTGPQGRASIAAVDDGCVVAGITANAIDFGGPSLGTPADRDLFAAKLDFAGNLVWARRYAAPGVQVASSITAQRDGNLAIALQSDAALDYGVPMPGVAAGMRDAYVLSIDAAGAPRWLAQVAAGDDADFAGNITEQAGGALLVVGELRGSGTVGSRQVTSAGGKDMFVVQLDGATGAPGWTFVAGSTGDDSLFGIAGTADGGAIATGYFGGTFAIGGEVYTASAYSDGLVLRLDPM